MYHFLNLSTALLKISQTDTLLFVFFSKFVCSVYVVKLTDMCRAIGENEEQRLLGVCFGHQVRVNCGSIVVSIMIGSFDQYVP